MALDINQFVQELDYKLNVFELKESASQCNNLVKFLLHLNESVPLAKAEKILQMVLNKRMFAVMQKVANTLLLTGRVSYKIQRQYAQSVIDSGNYTGAIYLLQHLISNTSNAVPSDISARSENAEAKGL